MPANEGSPVALWASQAWRSMAETWLDAQLQDVGIRRTGPVEQPHLRPWATVLKAPTTVGTVWLKALARATAFEARLYELLVEAAPQRVLTPIALDTARGWIVLPDGGPPLADRAVGTELARILACVLPHYAELQQAFAPLAPHAIRCGVADMRPDRMPERFDEALGAAGRLNPRGEHAALRRVAAIERIYGRWCEQLDGFAAPPSLDHNDLHTWNMLLPDLGRPDEVRFYDWGDSVLAHPFACLLVPLGWAQVRLGVDLDAPELNHIRDAYLEVFDDLGSHDELVEQVELACRVGKIARALTWTRAIAQAAPGELDEFYSRAPIQCLVSLLDESYLGGA